MSDVVIRAEGLGKKYLVGHQASNERYVALRDVLARTAKNFARSARDMVRGRPIVAGDEVEEFWALNDVNFEVRRGDVVGVIGRNGAGKSTLLKILSRITEPSAGRVQIKGRIASLLEVGTGFHPELTGRENIYLNGAILGMSRAEIKRKFDEIVAFAEVERFLDTPVKRYSSGMYVRLAFAVAAHLEPEILVVDEVLAVGDAEFQKKCLGKIGEVAGHGRTVLFVSHNIGSLMSICDTGILLNAGRVVAFAPIDAAVHSYRKQSVSPDSLLDHRTFFGPLRSVKFDALSLNGEPAVPMATADPREILTFTVQGRALESLSQFRFTFAIYAQGTRLLTLHDGPQTLNAGPFQFTAVIPAHFLRPGEFSIALGGRRVVSDDWTWNSDAASLEVIARWSADYDRDDEGLVNLRTRLSRITRTESVEQPTAAQTRANPDAFP